MQGRVGVVSVPEGEGRCVLVASDEPAAKAVPRVYRFKTAACR